MTKTDTTAREVLEVTMSLMRSIAAHMRQNPDRLAPPHVGVLGKVSEAPCSISDLAQHLAVRPPTISRTVSLLVDRGLLERWVPEENRRQTMVRITPAGKRTLESIRTEAERRTSKLLAALTPEQKRKIEAAMRLLSRAIEEGARARTPSEKGQ